ncbi:hypothetical protein LTR36_006306 [Oleoguttula mirabilis]|uniref:Ribonuclease H n=1 Tax=Oleoguttula mirabilis TaxID=1507867 RepID=A0AAV9JD16_9PEZI|nr:hypothetical protein LTR36_006306 [Oleoguttula mirabilis]
MLETDASHGFTSVNAASPAAAPPPPAPAPGPAPAAGTKRKRDAALKFYAVRVGKQPGIYHTWAECLDQVRGFPKAMFKSFTDLADAQHFVDANADSMGSSGVGGVGGVGGKVTKWYGVRSGRVPGVYTSWAQVLDQITGWKGPKHKGFKTRIEAELYVKEGQNGSAMPEGMAAESIEHGDYGTPTQKRAKTSKGSNIGLAFKDEHGLFPNSLDGAATGEYEPGEAPLPSDAEDGFDPSITIDPTTNTLRYKTGAELTKLKAHPARPALSAPIRIYTDGSSLANGQHNAIGGVGVYFGPGDKRNISEALAGSRQTNQRAELTAIARALEVAPRDRKIILLSDSNYAINCTNVWFPKWRANNWLNASRKPVENRDLIQKIIEVLEERYRMNKHRRSVYSGNEEVEAEAEAEAEAEEEEEEDECVDPTDESAKPPGPWERGPAGVKFVWVKGHAKDEGNNAADSLATAGAREAKELVEGAGDEYS